MKHAQIRKRILFILFIVTFCISGCGPFKKAKSIHETWPDGGRKDVHIIPVKPSENGIHPSKDKHYVEHWYFDARLDNGYVVVGFFWASEMMTHKPGVELHIYKPSGEKVSVVKSYPQSDFSAKEEICDVWVGKNHAHGIYPEDGGLPTYTFHISEGDLACDLTFRSEIQGWKPGGGKTFYDDMGFFAWVVAVPRAKVSGTIKIEGQEMAVKGIGYHDHNWETADLKRIISHWYWGRLYTKDFTLLYAYVKTNGKFNHASSTPLMLAYKDKIIYSTGEMKLTEGAMLFNAKADRTYPESLTIETPDNLSLKLNVKEIIDAQDLLEGKNRLLKWTVNKLIGHPGWFRFHSSFKLHVEIDGVSYDRSGETLHEMVALE